MHTPTRANEPASRPQALRGASGVLLTGAIAVLSLLLARLPFAAAHGITALTLAILGGAVIGNVAHQHFSPSLEAGIGFSKGSLLRIGVALYGFRLSVHDLAQVGPHGVLMAATVVAGLFSLAVWLGTRVFGLDRETAMLIGAGSSICGAAAVLATEPVLKAPSHKVSVAVATVVVFGTLGMFVYPALYPLLGLSQAQYGLFAGATIHEVAQVVVAGRAVGPEAANIAVIEKLIRVLLLAPFLLVLSWRVGRHGEASHGGWLRHVPWFAVIFIAIALLNSTPLVHAGERQLVNELDTVLLAMAMAGLGLHTRITALRQAGIRPLMLAASLFLVLMCGGYALTRLMISG